MNAETVRLIEMLDLEVAAERAYAALSAEGRQDYVAANPLSRFAERAGEIHDATHKAILGAGAQHEGYVTGSRGREFHEYTSLKKGPVDAAKLHAGLTSAGYKKTGAARYSHPTGGTVTHGTTSPAGRGEVHYSRPKS